MGRQGKRTRAELEVENQRLRDYGFGTNLTKVVRDLIKYGAVVWIVYFVYASIDSLSGKTTLANIDLKAKGELSSPTEVESEDAWRYCWPVLPLAGLFGIGGILYGRRQAKLRHDVIEREHQRTLELEAKLDPERTSSELTSRGDTRPEDL